VTGLAAASNDAARGKVGERGFGPGKGVDDGITIGLAARQPRANRKTVPVASKSTQKLHRFRLPVISQVFGY
jgi:hypothetical protein